MTIVQTPPAASARGGRLFKLTAEAYYRMIDAGAIGRDDRVELWEGQLVEKMGKNRPHVIALTKLLTALTRVVPQGWHATPEAPLEVNAISVPEPDLTVVRGAPDDFPRRPPTASDVALVVEVADSSVAKDVGRMLTAYAASGVAVYWVLNIPKRRIECYSEPTGAGPGATFRSRSDYGTGMSVPLILDGRPVAVLDVDDLLPRIDADPAAL